MGSALDAAFPISYRDLALMLADRSGMADHATLFRWVLAHAVSSKQRVRRQSWCFFNGPSRADETYVQVRGAWAYLCRAVDNLGQPIDFRLSPTRDWMRPTTRRRRSTSTKSGED